MNALHAGIVVKSLIKASRANEEIGGRIYSIVANMDAPYPYVTYQRTGTVSSGSKDRNDEEDLATVVVTVYAAKYEDSIRIADKIVASLIEGDTTIEGIEIGEIRLVGSDENFQIDAYVQNLVFNIEFINN